MKSLEEPYSKSKNVAFFSRTSTKLFNATKFQANVAYPDHSSRALTQGVVRESFYKHRASRISHRRGCLLFFFLQTFHCYSFIYIMQNIGDLIRISSCPTSWKQPSFVFASFFRSLTIFQGMGFFYTSSSSGRPQTSFLHTGQVPCRMSHSSMQCMWKKCLQLGSNLVHSPSLIS